MRFKTFSVLVGLSLWIMLSLFSLSPHTAAAAAKTYWRLVHASPDISAADVYVDGAPLVTNFHYGSVTGYVPTTPGTHKFQVAFVGQGIGSAVITQSITVAAEVPYTVAILGTKSSGYAVQNIQDDNSSVSSLVKLRAYQFSSDAGAVNVAANNGTIVNGLPYKQASNYVMVAAGAYTVKVTAVQSGLTVPDQTTLNAGTLTSVFAIGLVNGSPKLTVVTSQSTIIPDMPQTGSDPNAVPAAQLQQPRNPWFWVLVPLAAIGAALLLYRRSGTRKKSA